MSELVGRAFGSYEIIRELSHGGMAVVYLGRQTSMDRLVAIKVIAATYSQEPDFRARFDQEARTIARLEHPHILPVIDYGEEDFGAYLVMRYVEGGTLENRLQDGPLSLSETSIMLDKIASALDYAHAEGVIHRDLKPANILLDDRGNPYLTDFGIARILQSTQRLTQTGTAVGTPAYMAPEQWKAEEVGPYTDLYALGVVLYEMVTGDLPFKADTTYGFMHKHVYEMPDPPRDLVHDLPEAAEAVILKALAKLPEDRYPSGAALSEAFKVALSGDYAGTTQPDLSTPDAMALDRARALQGGTLDGPTELTPPPGPPPEKAASPPGRGRRGLWVLAAVAVIAVLGIGGLLAGGSFGGGAADTATPTESPGVIVAARPTDTATPGPDRTGTSEALAAAASSTSPPIRTATRPSTVTPAPTDAATITPTATRTATRTPMITLTATHTATATPTATRTPDLTATEDAALLATSQRVIRDLTATANAAILALATEQAAQTGTAIVIASFTPTPTPTWTPTQTPSRTPSPTGAATATPSPTVFRQASRTPTRTPFRLPTVVLPTITLRPSSMPTLAAFVTPTQSEARVSCPGMPPSLIGPGDIGFVSDEDPRPVNVRSAPGLSAARIGQLPVLARFTVLEGPTCRDGHPWFRVQSADGSLTGWIAESGEGVYYVLPLSGGQPVSQNCPGVMPTRLRVGMEAVVDTPTGLPLRMHDEPGASTPVVALIADGTPVTILAGVVCMDGYGWWQYQTVSGRVGWSSEADDNSYFLAPR